MKKLDYWSFDQLSKRKKKKEEITVHCLVRHQSPVQLLGELLAVFKFY